MILPPSAFLVAAHRYTQQSFEFRIARFHSRYAPRSHMLELPVLGLEALILEGKIRQYLVKGEGPDLLGSYALGDLMISKVIDLFYKHSRFLGGSTNWQTENEARMEYWIRPNLGKFDFQYISSDQIIKFYLSMKGKGLGRSSIHRTHALLCLFR